jgi:hypothetical protein
MAILAGASDSRMPILGWDMTRLAWIAVFAVVLLVLALVSIWHAIVGPIAWAVAGRESRRTRANR